MTRRFAPDARPGRPGRRDSGAGDPPREMPFLHHLAELRSVLIHTLIATVVGAIAGWVLAPRVLEDVIRRTVRVAVVLSPVEAVNERFKLALILGLAMALPYVFYRIWRFIVPGLLRRERSMILPMALASMLLFGLGAWAAYGYVVPLVIQVLSAFMTPSMKSEIRLSALLSFVYNLALACGLVFQLPLVTMALTAMGLVTPKFLLRQWRYAIVGVFIITAVITPGDVVSAQIVMGIPMTALYFLSVGLSYLVARPRKRAEVVEDSGEVQGA
ncbi:MAG: twin-arginine translocase subunit TatC [Candidatus Eisenbacteria bacterium]|nr:twin-arginine translocase subunit TatC [Candidatus Eisenbacteria bacterium]